MIEGLAGGTSQFMWRQSYGTNPSHRLHTVFQMGLTDGVDQ